MVLIVFIAWVALLLCWKSRSEVKQRVVIAVKVAVQDAVEIVRS